MSTDPSSAFAGYLVRELRLAELRARLAVNEIQAMKIALGAGFIAIDAALEHLAEVGVLHLIEASS